MTIYKSFGVLLAIGLLPSGIAFSKWKEFKQDSRIQGILETLVKEKQGDELWPGFNLHSKTLLLALETPAEICLTAVRAGKIQSQKAFPAATIAFGNPKALFPYSYLRTDENPR